VLCLVTGCAGFVGSTLSERLLDLGHEVRGVDRFSDYYPRPVKERNLTRLRDERRFSLAEADLSTVDLAPLIEGVDVLFHQAAQAGVRASWGESFRSYTQDNVLSTQRVLEASLKARVRKVVYASSSSVYGDTTDLPMRETSFPRPYSPYGVTKLAAEHLCELYRNNFGLPTASLRYFTVYGPRQRPDMGFNKFIEAWLSGEAIRVYGDGNQTRDFTFIADIVAANVAAMEEGKTGVFYTGGGSRVSLGHMLDTLREVMDLPNARIEHVGQQAGDVTHTWADCTRAHTELGFAPKTKLREGLQAQVEHQRRARSGRS
jgi:nucleoside-diphosphate-sugar epimerase